MESADLPPVAPPLPAAASRDAEVFARVFADVYGQLRAMAQQQMNDERAGHTLHATELVHKAFLRLVGSENVDWANQGHLIHAAATAMRRLLIEHARQRGRLKRGGGRQQFPLSGVDPQAPDSDDSGQLLALDRALRRLEEKDTRAGEIVRLRFYAGLTIDQTAQTLGISPRTVKREWEWARAWLSTQLS